MLVLTIKGTLRKIYQDRLSETEYVICKHVVFSLYLPETTQ